MRFLEQMRHVAETQSPGFRWQPVGACRAETKRGAADTVPSAEKRLADPCWHLLFVERTPDVSYVWDTSLLMYVWGTDFD